jgi:hypothetical protein
MSNEGYFNETLDEMKAWAEQIAGEWDGDFPGSQEDRAMLAEDIIKEINTLRSYINLMEDL